MSKRPKQQQKKVEAVTPKEAPQPTPAEAQIAVANQQQAQRVRTEHAVLKARFADVSVALAIAESERNQLITQLQSAQRTIERLTTSLAEATDSQTEPASEEAEKETSGPGGGKDVEPTTKES